MGKVTTSGQNNITSPNGNSLAVFVDGVTQVMKVKDVMGNIQPITDFIPTIIVQNGNYGLYAQTSLGTLITNTTVETSLIGTGVGTLTVPANGFNVGDSFTAKICGSLSCANNETIHIRVKSDGNVIADAGVFQMKITTNKFFELIIEFTVTKIGGLGVAELFVNGQYSYNQNANTNLDGVNFALVSNTTFNTTVSNVLSITAQWGASNVANKIQSQNFVLNKIY
jgi:hypothetical protein